MTEGQARDELCRIGKSLFERGYVHATAGNISLLLDSGDLLITPTDACLGFLDPAELACVNASGVQQRGLPASKTLTLHQRIYAGAREHDANVRCVIHTHSTHCVARSILCDDDELLPPITPYYVMKVGHVPLIPYAMPGDPGTADIVAHALQRYGQRGTPLRAVMLSRLGPVVFHDSPASAMAILEELEETARLCNAVAGRATPLTADDIGALRTRFSARW